MFPEFVKTKSKTFNMFPEPDMFPENFFNEKTTTHPYVPGARCSQKKEPDYYVLDKRNHRMFPHLG